MGRHSSANKCDPGHPRVKLRDLGWAQIRADQHLPRPPGGFPGLALCGAPDQPRRTPAHAQDVIGPFGEPRVVDRGDDLRLLLRGVEYRRSGRDPALVDGGEYCPAE